MPLMGEFCKGSIGGQKFGYSYPYCPLPVEAFTYPVRSFHHWKSALPAPSKLFTAGYWYFTGYFEVPLVHFLISE